MRFWFPTNDECNISWGAHSEEQNRTPALQYLVLPFNVFDATFKALLARKLRLPSTMKMVPLRNHQRAASPAGYCSMED
jgi:hypothetical protein